MKPDDWNPEREAALKALIRQTIDEMGADDAASLPHRIRRRLSRQAAGDADLDSLIQQVLAEKTRC